MASVTYRVPFADFDYIGWAEQIGLTATIKPTGAGDSFLRVEGPQPTIDQFSAELSWSPIDEREGC